jgi:hypothetical protein
MTLFAAGALVALLCPQVPAPAPVPDPAQVKSTVAALQAAYKKGEAVATAEALRAAAQCVHADVIKEVERGLAAKDRVVLVASIEALERMDHPRALDALEAVFDEKPLRADVDVFVALVRAIGRHGDVDSVSVLAEEPLLVLPHKVDAARIVALANIRTRESLDAVFSMMHTVGPVRGRELMGALRLSLAALTGADEGESRERWITWWNDHKRDFQVAPELGELPPLLRVEWNAFWGLEPKKPGKQDRKSGGDGTDPGATEPKKGPKKEAGGAG